MLPAVIVPKSDVVTVQGDCDESVSDVSDRVAALHTSVTRVPNDESVRVLYAQTDAGIDVIAEASDVDADETTAFVLLLTALATDEDAAVIAAPIEVDADTTSDCVASEPDVRPAPVSVLLPNDQMSDTVGAEPAAIVDDLLSRFVAI